MTTTINQPLRLRRSKELTIWQWILIFLLLAIPGVNIIALLIWAIGFGQLNRNLVSFARAFWVFWFIVSLFFFLSHMFSAPYLSSWFSHLTELLSTYNS